MSKKKKIIKKSAINLIISGQVSKLLKSYINSILYIKIFPAIFDRTLAGTYLTYSEDMIDIIMRQNVMRGIYLTALCNL